MAFKVYLNESACLVNFTVETFPLKRRFGVCQLCYTCRATVKRNNSDQQQIAFIIEYITSRLQQCCHIFKSSPVWPVSLLLLLPSFLPEIFPFQYYFKDISALCDLIFDGRRQPSPVTRPNRSSLASQCWLVRPVWRSFLLKHLARAAQSTTTIIIKI